MAGKQHLHRREDNKYLSLLLAKAILGDRKTSILKPNCQIYIAEHLVSLHRYLICIVLMFPAKVQIEIAPNCDVSLFSSHV
jgi:hypothetical protein